MMGPTIPPEQGHRSSDVLACPGKVWECFIILDDPLVHVVGQGACTPTVSVVLHLSLELRSFLLELESCFFELLVSGLQLLHPQAGWGPSISLSLIIEVIHWGSLFFADAFNVSSGVPAMKHS